MQTFELRPVDGAFELSGGLLEKPMVFGDDGLRQGVDMARFFSQFTGSELRIFDATDHLIELMRIEPVASPPGVLGGLQGQAP